MTEYHAYAGFWRRFGAFCVDLIVFLPMLILNYRLMNGGQSKWVALGILIIFSILFHFYQIYCHGRWGKTLGKFATGVKIVSLNFEPITYRQALLRSSVDILFTILTCTASVMAFNALPDDSMTTTGLDRSKLIISLYPSWWKYFDWGQQAWIWSEFIVMMTNSRRRALHDFIAGTVVIQVRGNKWDKENPYFKDYSKEIKRVEKMKDPFKI